MNRRAFLRGSCAAGVALAGAGAWRLVGNHVLCSCDGPAYSPWSEWQSAGESPFEALIAAAILASSPHNSQPWKFRLLPNGIDVYADTSRHIGAMDPLFREMHIGIGCALENLLLGAEAAGYRWSFGQPPLPDDRSLRPMARVLLEKAPARVPDLLKAIPERHTNRGPYDPNRSIDADLIPALESSRNSDTELRIFWFQEPEKMRAFGSLVVSATEEIVADREQSLSSARWIRSSWNDIQRYRDGITYDSLGLPPGMLALAKFLPPLTVAQTGRYWLEATRRIHVASAAAIGMIAVRDATNSRQQLEAGRLWQRMHLLATLRGIAMHPLNQPVERRDRELELGRSPSYATALAELQQDNTWQAVMPFRLGYPIRKALPSPRRSAGSTLI